MMKLYLLTTLLLFSAIMEAQTTKPNIGSDKDIKETFIKIKNGLPDIKKNLVIMEKQSNKYHPKIGLGNNGSYKEESGDQFLDFTYSSDGYSGNAEDFQNYYKTLVSIATEVFGADYTATASERGNVWRTIFLEKGQNVYTSATSIYIKYDGTFEPNFSITIEIKSEAKN